MDFLLDPWSWWIEPFLNNTEVRRALLVAVLIILCSATVGTWVVIRGMSFFTDALAHGILPGTSIALTLNGNITLGATVAALFMIFGIRTVRRYSPLPNDVSIGLLFVGMLALTLVLLGTDEGAEEELHEILFGNIFAVSTGDLVLQAIITVGVLLATLFFYRAFLTTTFDPVLSSLLRLRPGISEFALLILLAATMISGFKAVGSLFMFALIIAPPATAAILFKKVWAVMLAAVVQGFISAVLGILIGFNHNASASGTTGLVSVGIFFLVLALKVVVPKLSNRRVNALVSSAQADNT